MSDPHWDNVSLLMHMDGANGSTSFVDEKGKTLSTVGTAVISTAQSKFGGASGYFSGKDNFVEIPAHADFDFGTGDFTVELFGRMDNAPGVGQYPYFIRLNVQAEFNYGLGVGLNGDYLHGTIRRQDGSTIVGADGPLISLSTWYHLVLQRASGTLMFFVNGTRYANFPGYGEAVKGGFPSKIAHADGVGMFVDEVRVTKGLARYPNNPTIDVPSDTFPDTSPPPLIDAILSGQLAPSPLSNLLLANWPLVEVEASGALTPSGFLTVNNPQIIDGLLSGAMSPSGFLTVNNPQIIDGLLSGAMSPSGSVLVSSYWLIEAVASGRLSPSEAAHILIDNLDPGAMQFAQIVGELELYSEVIRSAQMAGKIDLFGTMSVTPEHEAQVAGVLYLIDGEASFCGCGNG